MILAVRLGALLSLVWRSGAADRSPGRHGRDVCTPSGRLHLVCLAFPHGPECNNFAKPYQRNPNQLWPGSPRNFRAVAFEKLKNGTFFPGLNFSWNPPDTGSMFAVKGFEISGRIVGGSGTGKVAFCRVLDLTEAKWRAEDIDVEFTFSIWPVPGLAEIYIELYCLPKPSVRHDQEKYQFVFVKTTESGRDSKKLSPGNWMSSITFANMSDERLVEVSFQKADEYKFDEYELELVPTLETAANPRRKRRVNKKENVIIFYEVCPGNYSILVAPYDPFRFQTGRCLCYTNPSEHRCVSCPYTRSAYFLIEGQVGVCKPVNNTKSTNHILSTSLGTVLSASVKQQRSKGSTQPMKIILSLIGVGVGLILLTVFCIFWNRKFLLHAKTKDDKLMSERRYQKCRRLGDNVLPTSTDESTSVKKKIFLVFTEDHCYHRNVIDCLVEYMEKYFRCEMWCAPSLSAGKGEESIQLMSKWIKEANFVLLLYSEAAFNCFKACKERKTYEHFRNGCVHDIFSQTMWYISSQFQKDRDYKKYIISLMTYTNERYVLQELDPGYSYKLPEHFVNMICHIHDLNPSMIHQADLPLNKEHAASCPEGLTLLEAISCAAAFERENPDWFYKLYGEPRPLETNGGCFSGDSAMENRKLSSGKLVDDYTWLNAFEDDLIYSSPSFLGDCAELQSYEPLDRHTMEHDSFIAPDEVPSIAEDETYSKSPSEMMKRINERYDYYNLYKESIDGKRKSIECLSV